MRQRSDVLASVFPFLIVQPFSFLILLVFQTPFNCYFSIQTPGGPTFINTMQTPSLVHLIAAALAASTAVTGFQAPSTGSVSRRAVVRHIGLLIVTHHADSLISGCSRRSCCPCPSGPC